MRISDWSSDVCSSDLPRSRRREIEQLDPLVADRGRQFAPAVGRAIVDHEYLMRGKALGERALDRRADMRGLVIKRHHHGKARNGTGLRHQSRAAFRDRKSVVSGKRVAVVLDYGGRGIYKKKIN